MCLCVCVCEFMDIVVCRQWGHLLTYFCVCGSDRVSQAGSVLGLRRGQGTDGGSWLWEAWPVPEPAPPLSGLAHPHLCCHQSYLSQRATLLAKFGSFCSWAGSGSQSHGGPYLTQLPAPPADPTGQSGP